MTRTIRYNQESGVSPGSTETFKYSSFMDTEKIYGLKIRNYEGEHQNVKYRVFVSEPNQSPEYLYTRGLSDWIAGNSESHEIWQDTDVSAESTLNIEVTNDMTEEADISVTVYIEECEGGE